MLASSGDDIQTYIWNTSMNQSREAGTIVAEPILAYHSEDPVTMLQWPIAYPEWICISFNRKMQLLKV